MCDVRHIHFMNHKTRNPSYRPVPVPRMSIKPSSPMNAPRPPDRSFQNAPTSRKVTGAFRSRAAANEAILALRLAGYVSEQIGILRPPPPSLLSNGNRFHTDFIKYVRHLLKPKRIYVRVTAVEIEQAIQILHERGGEVGIIRLFHPGISFPNTGAAAKTPLRFRNE